MDKAFLIQFGQCLQHQRVTQKLSQEQLADKLNVDRTYISLLERGKRNPSLLLLVSICRALNITPTDFFSAIEQQDIREE